MAGSANDDRSETFRLRVGFQGSGAICSLKTDPCSSVKNQIPLDDMDEAFGTLRGEQRYWTAQSLALDWSDPDRADPEILNRVIWHTVRGMDAPYPVRE